MGGGVKSCAELLSGLVMEQEIFPGVVALRQAGTHCLAVEGWEHNAQVPHCAGLHGLPLAAPWEEGLPCTQMIFFIKLRCIS